ncbi:MAG: hypothetical protein U0264_00545 [Candidatus Kapaibacterium sp.]
MKNRIGRTLLWFKDENGIIKDLLEDFLGISMLLNRLLNEVYAGKPIEFINLSFANEEYYTTYTANPVHSLHYVGSMRGYLEYYGALDYSKLCQLSEKEQRSFIWEEACKYLQAAALKIKNPKLYEASEYAHKKGLEGKLNTDYRVLEVDAIVYGVPIKVSVSILFKHDAMYSILTIEKEGTTIWTKNIDICEKGNGFFLEAYKKIIIEDTNLIVKGHYLMKSLPLKIHITPAMVGIQE